MYLIKNGGFDGANNYSPVRKKGNRWIGISDGVNEIRSEVRRIERE